MGLNLLEKTELWINEITLDHTNLTDLANAVARSLGLSDGEVLVVDVRPRHITLDVLATDIPQENIIGREAAILDAVGALPGVTLYPETYIHSNGILGQICAGADDQSAMLERVSVMTEELRKNVSRRAIVFPTGFEIQQGLIEDTNTPYLKNALEQAGRHVKDGVRIGVGSEGLTTMVSLPGPHDEVELAVPILLRGLAENWDKSSLANRLASVLAEKWRQKRPLHHQPDQ